MTAPVETCRWEQAANGFPEIPKGKKVMDLWYNPAVRPRQTSPSPRGPAEAGEQTGWERR